jgi:hypothetical protein
VTATVSPLVEYSTTEVRPQNLRNVTLPM